MNINPNDPAFPTKDSFQNEDGTWRPANGMTIRTQIAAMAMQGILSNSDKRKDSDIPSVVLDAVKCADALRAELSSAREKIKENGEDAIAFADYIVFTEWKSTGNKWVCLRSFNSKPITTAELYQLFKQQQP